MVIWGHMVFVTGYRVSEAVVGYVYHQIKIISTDRFVDHTLGFTCSETRYRCGDDVRVAVVSFECNFILMCMFSFLSPAY